MAAKPKKETYISPYKSEMIGDYLVQYIDDKTTEMELRERIISKRPEAERLNMRITPYFQTRCKNLVIKMDATKEGDDFVDLLVKSVGVSMSGYFPYRDVIDIINKKKNTLTFDASDEVILGYVIKSLELNHVIAPKIAAIYKILHGEEMTENPSAE